MRPNESQDLDNPGFLRAVEVKFHQGTNANAKNTNAAFEITYYNDWEI
jgi:hypothetical protein